MLLCSESGDGLRYCTLILFMFIHNTYVKEALKNIFFVHTEGKGLQAVFKSNHRSLKDFVLLSPVLKVLAIFLLNGM